MGIPIDSTHNPGQPPATRASLTAAIKEAEAEVQARKYALAAFNVLATNNVFPTLREAAKVLERALTEEAAEACEGSGNFGMDQYTRACTVDCVEYLACLDVEYNRHDKQYYYVETAHFSIKPMAEVAV